MMPSDFPDFPKDDFGRGPTPPPGGPGGRGGFNPPPPGTGGMFGRIQRIILTPKAEWPAIEADPMTMQQILLTWVAPLAAIGPIIGLIRTVLFPIRMPYTNIVFYPSPIGAVVQCVLGIALTILGVWVWSLILDMLAPNFKGVKNPIAALKLVAFSATAAWLCGVFQISWFTMWLAILGLYSAYIFWVGVPVMMKVPEDQAPIYVLIAVVIGVVVNIVVGAIVAGMVGAMFLMAPANPLGAPGGGVITVGGTTIDTNKLNDAANKMAAAGKAIGDAADGKPGAAVKAADPNALQAMIPSSVAGFSRSSVESQSGGVAGINGSSATGQFQSGDQNFTLSVVDTGAMGGVMTLGGALTASHSKQTDTGYEKTEMQGGNWVTEEWDNATKRGKYSILINSRFMIEASGSAPNIDALKAAVGAVNASQLSAM